MATKRRKMWAVVDDEGRGSQVFLSLKAAKRWAAKEPRDGTGWHVVAYLERLPGDVVLSREEADWLRRLAEATDFDSSKDRERVLALLRGRR